MRTRLDQALVVRKLVGTRSQAESWIRLGKVTVDGRVVLQSSLFVQDNARVELTTTERYVSRAGLKLASVAQILGVDFAGTTVLDVGSSTGGFTDYALQHGARLVYAVDVGVQQLHPTLRDDERIQLHEQTDIRDFRPSSPIDIVVIDVSFISLRDILPHIAQISSPHTTIVAMFKPQFEAGARDKHNGVIKNDAVRRQLLREFEVWLRRYFVLQQKADSEVKGAKGNQERFYKLSSTTNDR